MKTMMTATVVTAAVLMTTTAQAQTPALVRAIERKAAALEKLLATDPVFYDKQSHDLVILLRFEGNTVGYDVQKTDSLVSPYMGYISWAFSPLMSHCGDRDSIL